MILKYLCNIYMTLFVMITSYFVFILLWSILHFARYIFYVIRLKLTGRAILWIIQFSMNFQHVIIYAILADSAFLIVWQKGVSETISNFHMSNRQFDATSFIRCHKHTVNFCMKPESCVYTFSYKLLARSLKSLSSIVLLDVI